MIARLSNRGAAAAKSLVAAAALLIAVSVAVPISQDGSGARSTAGPDARLRDTLRSSWVTDGHRGFFVTTATGGPSLVSLYQTGWWSNVARQTEQASGLDDSAVAQWLGPLIDDSAYEIGDTAGMPLIERLSIAVPLAIATDTPFDRSAVSTQLESLRQGDLYRASRDSRATFTNTSTAVRILRSIGKPIPAIVTEGIRRRYALALDSRTTSDIPMLTVPALASMETYPAKDFSAIRSAIEWVLKASQATDGLSRLAVSAVLSQVGGAVGLDPEVLRGACPNGSSRPLTSATDVDPHVLSDTLMLGCTLGKFVLPPATRQGFPTEEALSTQVEASAQAMAVADALGVAPQYRAKLAVQLKDVWQAGRSNSHSEMAEALLERSLGARTAAGPRGPIAGTVDSVQECISGLAVLWISDTAPTGVKGRWWTRCPDAPGSILGVVEEELVARVEADSAKHDAAVRRLRTLSAGAQNSIEPGGGADLWATLLGR